MPAALILNHLATASDDQLVTSLSKAVQAYIKGEHTSEEDKQFVHELRDWAVFIGGASSFVMTTFAIVCGEGRSYPPPLTQDYDLWLETWKLK